MTTSKITEALHAVMAEVAYVQKTGKNTFHNYKYAGEGDLLAKLRPAMIKHGLLLIPSVTHVSDVDQYGNTRVMMEYTLVHKDGEVWPTPIGAAGMGNDKNKQGGVGDKGLYKALTGANKYLLFKLFQIETGDDPEVASVADETGSPEPEPGMDLDAEERAEAELIASINAQETTRGLDALKRSTNFVHTYSALSDDAKSRVARVGRDHNKALRKDNAYDEHRMAG